MMTGETAKFTRDTTKTVERDRKLTADELDAVSGGAGWNLCDKASPKLEATVGGGGSAGKVMLLFPF
jgi:hypothetical protein